MKDAGLEIPKLPTPIFYVPYEKRRQLRKTVPSLAQQACQVYLANGGDISSLKSDNHYLARDSVTVGEFLASFPKVEETAPPDPDAIICRIVTPPDEIYAQIIYDASLLKGYLLHQLPAVSAKYPSVVIDVAYFVEPGSESGHVEYCGGGEMGYSFEQEDPLPDDLAYKYDQWVNLDLHKINSENGWEVLGYDEIEEGRDRPEAVTYLDWVPISEVRHDVDSSEGHDDPAPSDPTEK
jgi:hypothetical protein